MKQIQLDAYGQLRHFLSIEGLSRQILTDILDYAERLSNDDRINSGKLPLLRDKTIANLFMETDTDAGFVQAENRLSADILDMDSSATRGRPISQVLHGQQSLKPDLLVVGHKDSGATHLMAANMAAGTHMVNAGDGQHANPVQAMGDMLSIRHHKGEFDKLRVAIIGDLLHGAAARSQIHALSTLHTGEIRVIAPRTLLPSHPGALGVHAYHNLSEGLREVDVVIVPDLDKRHMSNALIPSEQDYFQQFGLTPQRLAKAKADVIVMPTMPFRPGATIDARLADSEHMVIAEQQHHGIAVRMAILCMLLGVRLPPATKTTGEQVGRSS